LCKCENGVPLQPANEEAGIVLRKVAEGYF